MVMREWVVRNIDHNIDWYSDLYYILYKRNFLVDSFFRAQDFYLSLFIESIERLTPLLLASKIHFYINELLFQIPKHKTVRYLNS